MWQSVNGPRQLAGKERRLSVTAPSALFDHLSLDDPDTDIMHTDVAVIDRVPLEDRPYVLLTATRPLRNASPPPPPLAWNEGDVLAVFRRLEFEIEIEVDWDKHRNEEDSPNYQFWRTLVRDAWMEC